MIRKKNILVTGGLGYIGSHTVVELIEKGFEVTIIDNLVNSRIEILTQIKKITGVSPVFYQEDVLNKEKLLDIFHKEKIDGVIHFAAHLLVGESVKNPLKYYNNNLGSLINLLGVMKQNNVGKFIFSSSCTVYGNPEKFPVTEETPIGKASSPYGTTKIFSEKIIEDSVYASDSLNAVLLRYFNPVGAHESCLIGENVEGEPNHLFPILAEAFRCNKPFNVFGKNYNTKDGTPVRDYIHVIDLAKAHVAALHSMFKFDKNEVKSYNIGTGKGYSVLEIINEFKSVTKKEIEIVFKQKREGDVEEIWAEPSLAKEELGWQPKYDLKSMVETSVNWDKFQVKQGWC